MTEQTHDLIGTGRRAAYALAALPWPGDALSRVTLRALIPRGTPGPSGDRIVTALRGWLRQTEERGYIKRGGLLILVLDRAALLGNVQRHLGRAVLHDFVCPEAAMELVAARLRTEPNEALAARLRVELAILDGLASR